MLHKIFVTATDTDVGKTFIATKILSQFSQLGFSTLGIKPVATGCYVENNALISSDARLLQQASTIKLDYAHINPFVFEPPISPNLAAKRVQHQLTVSSILKKTEYALTYPADLHVIEGIGGWHVPLNADETMADYVQQAKLAIILVVKMKLGCLNHAILTYQAINARRLPFIAWVAVGTNLETREANEMVATLKDWIAAPFLGKISLQNPSSLDINASNLKLFTLATPSLRSHCNPYIL